MPAYRQNVVLEVARGMKAFLNFEAGLTRGQVPEDGQQSRKLEQVRRWLEGKTQNLERTRKKLEDKERQIAELEKKLDENGSGAPAGESGKPVFFVVGRAKSGTTWLMRILNSHPEILCKGEGRFFGHNWKREGLKQEGKSKQPGSLYNSLLEAEYLRLWIERSIWSREGDADKHLDNLTRLATNYFLEEELSKTGKSIVGDKTPLLGPEIAEDIGKVHPQAKVIHIIRDGRDSAVSQMHHIWNVSTRESNNISLSDEELDKRAAYREDPQKFIASGQSIFTDGRLRSAAESWKNVVSKTVEDGPALLGENYTEVRYEDLLERPREEARRLFEFLGADTSEKVVERCTERTSFERRTKGRERGQEDSTSNFRKGIAGDWKNVFTEQDKNVFKETAGDLLIKLGYERDDDW